MEVRTDLTPPPPGPFMEFRTVRNVTEDKAVVLSPRIWAHHVHWLGNVTVPCDSEKGRCELCELQKPTRWAGYLLCWDYGRGSKQFFLCITPKAGYDLMQAAEYEVGLRGRMIVYRRATKSSTSALVLRFDAYLERKPEDLPQDLNPRPYLEQLFKKATRRTVQQM